MISARLRFPSAPLLAMACALGACSGTTGLGVVRVEMFIASGDGQYGTTGQVLSAPLQVLVRGFDSQLPQRDVNVLWSVESGAAQVVSLTNTLSDSTGTARATIRLGTVTGPIVVRASVEDQPGAIVDFQLFAVDRPEVSAITPSSGAPGSTVTLTGSNFSPNPDQDVVLFSGVRATVAAASATELQVVVPECLPARSVGVSVQLGTVASAPLAFDVGPGATVTALAVGQAVDRTDPEGLGCVLVSGAGGAQYLVLVQSTSSLGAATHPFELTGLGATPTAAPRAVEAPPVQRSTARADRDPQEDWDIRLRALEAELTRGIFDGPRRVAPMEPLPSPGAAPAPVPPVLNERRTFQVFRNPGDFVEVSAVARYVGQKAALFLDEAAPPGYSQADLESFSDLFDDVIHPTVTGAFGNESDIDDNGRVIILFSPAVNALTPRGASGFIAGFFFGLDLRPAEAGSNGGEVFYALVPDPAGTFSDPRTRGTLLDIMPAILAHEFQHMVSFNERVLVGQAPANEAVWLSEALAQYAEELVGREYDGVDAAAAELFRTGTRTRARRYLASPDSVSLVISAGSGSLAERGASFLYLAYLADRFGEGLPGRLTRTTRTGVSNVEAETGTDWGTVLSDWWAAVYLDGPGPESGDLVYPTVDLRQFLGAPYPLVPRALGPGDFSRTGSLRSAAVQYYIVNPGAGGSATLRLGGEAGAGSSPQAGLRMRVVRIQ